jgi:hypothetical protein
MIHINAVIICNAFKKYSFPEEVQDGMTDGKDALKKSLNPRMGQSENSTHIILKLLHPSQ